jgi:hypothetical protein
MIAFTKKDGGKKNSKEIVLFLLSVSTLSLHWSENDELKTHDLFICYIEQDVTQMLSASFSTKSYLIIKELLS